MDSSSSASGAAANGVTIAVRMDEQEQPKYSVPPQNRVATSSVPEEPRHSPLWPISGGSADKETRCDAESALRPAMSDPIQPALRPVLMLHVRLERHSRHTVHIVLAAPAQIMSGNADAVGTAQQEGATS